MGLRNERVNELVRREISDFLHVRYRSESTRLTILSARISPDLRNGTVAYSVLGDEEHVQRVMRFFKAKTGEIRHALGKRVVLKYLPKLRFVRDDSIEKGDEIIRILDSLKSSSDHDSLGAFPGAKTP